MKKLAFWRRLSYAWEGIVATWREETNFRIHCLGLGFLLLVLSLCAAEPLWWAVCLLAAGVVLLTELLNTALENLVDLAHPDLHPLAKRVKDSAAGAVLVASCAALAVFVAFLCSHWAAFRVG